MICAVSTKKLISLFEFVARYLLVLLVPSVYAYGQVGNPVGAWNFNVYYQSSNYPQPWTISTFDSNSGAISGNGNANGYNWTFSGSISGNSISMDFIYTNLPTYFGNLTGTFSNPCFMSGTWTAPNQSGTWDGTKVGCNGSGQQSGTKDPTGISMFCNRYGVGLSEASCAVTVGDSGPPPRTTPTGSVDFVATGGFFPANASCILQQTQYSPGVASCTAYFQVPFGFPIATAFPIDAVYGGDSNFDPSATSHELIQAGCIGTPENPCPGSVSLTFDDIPQIIDGLLSSVVACGGPVTSSATLKTKTSYEAMAAEPQDGNGECTFDLEISISASQALADMEDQAVLSEFSNQINAISTKAFTDLEKVFFKALENVSKSMATNQSVYQSHIKNQPQVQQTLQQEMINIVQNQQNPSPATLAAKSKGSKLTKKQLKEKPFFFNKKSAVVKINKQKTLKQKAPKSTKAFLEALRKSGAGTATVNMKLKSVRLGKLPKGIKRKATINQQINIGLSTVN